MPRMPAALVAGDMTLVAAGADQLSAVERVQRAAYARNRDMLGLEPLPLQADYAAILRDHEVWVKPGAEPGLGRKLLAAAEVRARDLGRGRIRLYTGEPLTHLIDWYGRNGYEVERTEVLPDRRIVHMLKTLA